MDCTVPDFQIFVSKSIMIFCDNQVALQIASILIFHERTKHIQIDCYFVLEKLAR